MAAAAGTSTVDAANATKVESTTTTTSWERHWEDRHFREALRGSAERRKRAVRDAPVEREPEDKEKETDETRTTWTGAPSPLLSSSSSLFSSSEAEVNAPLLRWYRCKDPECERSSCTMINIQDSEVCIRHPSGFYIFTIYNCTHRQPPPASEEGAGYDLVHIEIFSDPLCSPAEKQFERDQNLNECLFNGGEKQGNYEFLECS